MTNHVHRSIKEPIRPFTGMAYRWDGSDKGLIWCWERGRQLREENPQLAQDAERGELPILDWKGGVEKKLKVDKLGTLQYLATWQGLRGEDLDVSPEGERIIVCSKTGQRVVFSAKLPVDE